MLAAIRIAAVVAVIFYLSPVRRASEAPIRPGTVPDGVREGLFKSRAGDIVTTADALLQKLPEAAKQAAIDRVRAHALGSSRPPSADAPSAVARDTLELEDLQPAWRGGTKDKAVSLEPRPKEDGVRAHSEGQRTRP
jgi:hypothetical protein